jgi:hypothetical protein
MIKQRSLKLRSHVLKSRSQMSWIRKVFGGEEKKSTFKKLGTLRKMESDML